MSFKCECESYRTLESLKIHWISLKIKNAQNIKSNGYLVKILEFSKIVMVNVDRYHMLSLSVKVLFSYLHFQEIV